MGAFGTVDLRNPGGVSWREIHMLDAPFVDRHIWSATPPLKRRGQSTCMCFQIATIP